MYTDKAVFRIFNHYDMIKNISLYINNYYPMLYQPYIHLTKLQRY